MDDDRIATSSLAPKLAAIIQIGTAAGADSRLQLELLGRRFPQVDPIIVCSGIGGPDAVVQIEQLVAVDVLVREVCPTFPLEIKEKCPNSEGISGLSRFFRNLSLFATSPVTWPPFCHSCIVPGSPATRAQIASLLAKSGQRESAQIRNEQSATIADWLIRPA